MRGEGEEGGEGGDLLILLLSSNCCTTNTPENCSMQKTTESFISRNILLQIVKSLNNVAYLVFVMI